MKQKLQQIAKHPLIKGSTIVLIGSLIANVVNYAFNLMLGRLLIVTDYGIYATLMSFLALFGIVPGALTNIFARFAATYKAKNDEHTMHTLFFRGLWIVVSLGVGLTVILLLATGYISSFLHITDIRLLFLLDLTIFLSIVGALTNGLLQGEMKLFFFSAIAILTPVVKIIVGLCLLLIGWKVFGVAFALFISSLLSGLGVLLFFWKKYQGVAGVSSNTSVFLKDFSEYGVKFFFATLGITLLTSIDIMLVKHFYSPEKAGQYAALAVMGRSIFYLTSPIYFVFFPLIAQKKERKESIVNTLLLAVFIIMACSVFLSFIYFLFPTVILQIFFPAKEYTILGTYLGPYSLYITVFSLAMLTNNFLLSIGKSGVYKINLVVSVLVCLLLYAIHETFYQVIGVLFGTSLLLLVMHLLYYALTRHEKN